MAWTLVGHAQAAAAGSVTVTTAGVTWSATPDLVVVIGATYTGAVPVSDSSGNTWSTCTPEADGSSTSVGQISYCQGGTFPNGVTFTLSQINRYPSITVMGFTGSGALPLDVQSGNYVNSPATTVQPDGGSGITPSQGNSLIITGLSAVTNTPYSINDGFTMPDPGESNVSGRGTAGAYLVQSTAAQINPTWTVGSNLGYPVVAVIAAFKPAAGAAFTWLEMTPLSEPLRLVPEMVGY